MRGREAPQSSRACKDAVFDHFARITEALASSVRLEIVDVRRDGARVHYRLTHPQVVEVWRVVRTLGERQLAEIDRAVAAYLGDPAGFEPITAAALLERLETGDAIVIDVRPEEEYRAGHIRGARSIPLGQPSPRLAELPLDATVVAYCRGPSCVMSDEALGLLKAHGRHGLRLADGLPDWRAAGHAVDVVRNCA